MQPQKSEEKRTAILVRCTAEEAELIRDAAKAEHRTISGFILNAVLQRIAVSAKVRKRFQETFGKGAQRSSNSADR